MLKISIVLLSLISMHSYSGTLETVKKNGFLRCGVSTGLAGFSSPNSKGEWRGLDVDFCRAISAAVFGDPTKVRFISLNAQQYER